MDIIQLGVNTPYDGHWLVDVQKVRQSRVFPLELLTQQNKIVFSWLDRGSGLRISEKNTDIELRLLGHRSLFSLFLNDDR
jgi:hypothetical protein